MKDGIALVNRFDCRPYIGSIVVYNPTKKVDLKRCKKCDKCGHLET